MSTPHPSVPAGHPGPSKLQLENQSLKRRLVQYAATLEKLTTHAKREIDQSTRARDEALSRAADASALRQKLSSMTESLSSAESSRDAAAAARARAEARVEQLQATLASMQRRLDDARYDDAHVSSMREELASLQRELPDLRRLREQHAARADALDRELHAEKQRSADSDAVTRRLQQLQTASAQLTAERDAANLALDATRRTEAALTRERDDALAKLRDSHDVADMLRQQLDQAQDRLRALEHRLEDAQAADIRQKKLAADAKRSADDAVAALRNELDSALKQLGDRNAMFDDLKLKHDRSIDAESALAERDSLQTNIRQLQVELDQSTEMLTRAAIDALGDKAKIRKLEDAISKLRAQLDGEQKEKASLEARIGTLTQQIAALEAELDHARSAKRELADKCHQFQLQIHERDSVMATKNRALEELDTDRSDRAFQIDRLKLELSNAKNALAKKESDLVKITTEHEEMCSVLKSTNRDLDDKHSEVSAVRRDLAAAGDQISKLSQEREHLKVTIAELQEVRRQVEELSALVNSKDEELGSMKRWCTTLKAEAGESVREKKKLSDMLSDVSGDLKRANHELELLRNLRLEQEQLAKRISHISETSSRELNDMRKSQSEQAEVLAKSTVEAYQGRLVEIQKSARHEIAETVSSQLRDDIMPHLMRAVDAKARNLVHALAKHVESFTVEDAVSYGHAKDYGKLQPSSKVEVGRAASMDQTTEYTSASRSVSQSANRSIPPPSATESPSISVANATHGEYTGADTTAEPSAITSDRSIEAARGFTERSSVPTATSSAQGVPSETIEFHSEDVDSTDEIDPVAIHNRLTETYKELLGGGADLDLDAFQSVSHVVEQNVTIRQETYTTSAQPTEQVEGEQVAAELAAADSVAVETREITSLAVEQQVVGGADALVSKVEDELEIVESYIPKEDEVDESFEGGEEPQEGDVQEQKEKDVQREVELSDDAVEEFKDALGEVVSPVEVESTEDRGFQEAEEGVEISTSQEATRGFAVEPRAADEEADAEDLAQAETEGDLQHASGPESAPSDAVPIEAEATASEEASRVRPEVAVPNIGEAEDASKLGSESFDSNRAVEEDVGFRDESPAPAGSEGNIDAQEQVQQVDTTKDDPPTEPVDQTEKEAFLDEAAVGFREESAEPTGSEEEIADREVSQTDEDVYATAVEPVEEAYAASPVEETDAGLEDQSRELIEREEESADEGNVQQTHRDLHAPSNESVDETFVAPPVDEAESGFSDEQTESNEAEEPIDAEEMGQVDQDVDVSAGDAVYESEPATSSDEPEMGFRGESYEQVEAEEDVEEEEEVQQVDPDASFPIMESAQESEATPMVSETEVGLREGLTEPAEPEEDIKDEGEVQQADRDIDVSAMEPTEESDVSPLVAGAEGQTVDESREPAEPVAEIEDKGEAQADRDVDVSAAELSRPSLDETGEIDGAVENDEKGDRPFQQASSGTSVHVPEVKTDNEGTTDPEVVENVENAPVEDENNEEREPMEFDDHDRTHEREVPGFGEGGGFVDGAGDAPTAKDHEPSREQAAERIDEESHSGLSTEAPGSKALEEEDDGADTEQPRALDLSASIMGGAHEGQAKGEGGTGGSLEENVSTLEPLEISHPTDVVEEDVDETRFDLSSGHDDTGMAVDKDVLSRSEEEQDGAIVSNTSDAQSPEDEFVTSASDGLPQRPLDDLDGRSNGANLHDAAIQAPSTEQVIDEEHGASESEGAEEFEEEDEEYDEDIEEIDATRVDYGADAGVEPEAPVLTFAALNVLQGEGVLDDDEDDEDEDFDDEGREEDQDHDQEQEYEDAQNEVDELDLTEGVPADLDGHSDLDDEYGDVVNDGGFYDHVAVEEFPDDDEYEEAKDALGHEGETNFGPQETREAASTVQNISSHSQQVANPTEIENTVEGMDAEQDVYEDANETPTTEANTQGGSKPAQKETLATTGSVQKAKVMENEERHEDAVAEQIGEPSSQVDAPEGGIPIMGLGAVEPREGIADDGRPAQDANDSVEDENILRA